MDGIQLAPNVPTNDNLDELIRKAQVCNILIYWIVWDQVERKAQKRSVLGERETNQIPDFLWRRSSLLFSTNAFAPIWHRRNGSRMFQNQPLHGIAGHHDTSIMEHSINNDNIPIGHNVAQPRLVVQKTFCSVGGMINEYELTTETHLLQQAAA